MVYTYYCCCCCCCGCCCCGCLSSSLKKHPQLNRPCSVRRRIWEEERYLCHDCGHPARLERSRTNHTVWMPMATLVEDHYIHSRRMRCFPPSECTCTGTRGQGYNKGQRDTKVGVTGLTQGRGALLAILAPSDGHVRMELSRRSGQVPSVTDLDAHCGNGGRGMKDQRGRQRGR